ncbi:MAG TPA: DUF1272 domain-containing protein [Candidatus Nitrosotalea sp.]|nr:DUF1272 domain-containing protein [Candidatus Nitrosotalea sp.]
MKSSCERCGAPLRDRTEVRVCSHECTFCTACTDAMSGRCPNCGGVLAAPKKGA